MRSATIKRIAIFVIAFGVVVGCDSTTERTFDSGPQPFDEGSANVGDGTTEAENIFSDAPQSPGGTGGVIEDQVDAEGEETQSFFTAYQIDPEAEDTAGPKFVVAADMNNDGLLDLVSGWNESQPIQMHLQGQDAAGNISFRTISLGGTSPIALTAGVEVGYINDDEWLDVVLLIKATGAITVCPPIPESGALPTEIGVMDGLIIVLFSPASASAVEDGDEWELMWIESANRFPGFDAASFHESGTKPELSGFVSLAVGEIDGAPGDDIVVAFNAAKCDTLGQDPPINTVELYPNPGGLLSESGPDWQPVNIQSNAPQVKDVLLMDIDVDGDLDIVSSWTDSTSSNVMWRRNPLIPHEPGGPEGTSAVHQGRDTWEYRPLGHVATGADILASGDIDGDGYDDVAVRSTTGQIVQWFRRPTVAPIEPIFPPDDQDSPDETTVPDRTVAVFPWQVYTLAVFDEQEPEAISVGDVTGDGQVEVMIAAEGAVYWYDGTVGNSLFDEWVSSTVIRDNPPDETDPTAASSGVPGGAGITDIDASTYINTLLVVDLDGDGKNDIIGTLDRRNGSGLSDDRLVWYRNTRSVE